MQKSRPPWPSRSVKIALGLTLVLAAWGDLSRLRDPLGDKLVFTMPPGAADFIAPYQGARALVAGEDPYRNAREEFRDPWRRELIVDGVPTSQFYPPTHLLLLTPLVPIYGGDLRAAGRAWFVIDFVVLLLLGVVTSRLIARALEPAAPDETLLTLFCCAALMLHGGALLGLERGQSDPLIALLAWSGILFALDGKFARAAFLAMLAALLKGYAVGLALGVIAAGRERRSHLRAAAGAGLAVLVGLVPVARLVPAALHNMRLRVGNFHPAWYNVSFRSLTELTTPFAARPLAIAACLLALVAALVALVAARRAATGPARAAWLSLFGGAAMTATLGAPGVTYSYALVNVLPGALLLALAHEPIAAPLSLSQRGRQLLAVTVIAMLGLFFALRLGSPVFPLAPLGLIAFVATVALLAARALRTG